MAFALGLLGNRWGQMALIAISAYLYGFWSVPRVDVAAVQRHATEARDNHWRAVLAEKEREANAELAAAIEARDATPPVPVADADLDKLCQSSRTCSDNRRSK